MILSAVAKKLGLYESNTESWGSPPSREVSSSALAFEGDVGSTGVLHSHDPRMHEKDGYYFKPFLFVILILTSGDNPSSSFLGFVVQNIGYLSGLDFISGKQ